MKRVICKSGVVGWQCKLQENYLNFEEFAMWSDIYGIATKLGYKTSKAAWRFNPLIRGSINPKDLQKSI